MKATIYHNPMCGTSRKTLEILRDSGWDVSVHEYLKSPPSRAELVRLYGRAGISPRDGLRAKEPLAQELGLNRAGVTDDEVLDAMIAHPILINRPIVVTADTVKLCRPSETVLDILPHPQRSRQRGDGRPRRGGHRRGRRCAHRRKHPDRCRDRRGRRRSRRRRLGRPQQ